MTEQHHPEQQPKTPQLLNQELKSLFQLLPDFNIFYTEKGTYINPVTGQLLDVRPPEQRTEDLDNLESQLERRKRSQIRPMLQDRLQRLLGQSHLTPSARTYVGWEFDEMTVDGLEREDYPPKLLYTTELQYYIFLFQWDNPESGGIFNPEQARDIDRRLYRRAVDGILTRQRMDGQLAGDEGFQDLLRQAGEAGREMKERIKTMTPEEFGECNRMKAKEDATAYETLQKWKDEEELVL